jgi:Ca2+/H+ antiporter, TMEM165/GDT1 family
MANIEQKPNDLPEKPHDIPPPPPPTIPNDIPEKPLTSYPNEVFDFDDEDDHGVIQPFHSFILSFAMIIFSEIGDKTFLVAALMAMRHPRLIVFSAAFAALVAMTVLSAVLGHAVPALLSKRFTSFLAAILFFVFGARLLREGLAMSPDEGVGEEMREVEQELEEKEHQALKSGRRRSDVSAHALEAGRGRRSKSNSRFPAPPRSPSSTPSHSPAPRGSSVNGAISGLHNLFSLLLSPAWVQTFIMTFLGEWGDRSQIATIAMAAGQDYWWVTIGAISGHAICTAAAVIGGRAIAGRVSMRKGQFEVILVARMPNPLTRFQSPLAEPLRSSSSVSSTRLRRSTWTRGRLWSSFAILLALDL